MEFQVGDRVKYKWTGSNNIPYGTLGTVTDVRDNDEYPIRCRWDNGYIPSPTTWFMVLDTSTDRIYIEHYKGNKIMKLTESLTNYISRNQDTFFTIAIVILLDHYLFEGALRSKLKSSVEGMIDALPGAKN